MLQEIPGQLASDANGKTLESAYDPLCPDAYAMHLAEVNNAREVIASEDIFNSNGLLLVKKGAPITTNAMRSIVNIKLLHPLESSVTIKNDVDGSQLQKHLMAVMKEDDVLSSIHDRYDLSVLLHDQCLSYQSYPLLRQKITVLYERMPETFSRTLYCAWLGMLIAKEMRLPEQDINSVFLAALGHDIGMLHINPEVLNKKEELNAQEWRQIQAHVVVGQKILESITGLPKQVSLAVFEHHERCDGTGYPTGKVESELSLLGQIIALADSVIAVYHNRFKSQGRSWRDVIPIIQMNSQAYFYRNYEILVTILRRSELPQRGVVVGDEMPAFIDEFIEKVWSMRERFMLFETTLLSLGFTHGDRKLHALQNVFLHVATSVNGSGIFLEGYISWLEQVKEDDIAEALREVEDAYLMLEEVDFHLLRLGRMIQMYVAAGNCKSDEIKALLERGVAEQSELDRNMSRLARTGRGPTAQIHSIKTKQQIKIE